MSTLNERIIQQTPWIEKYRPKVLEELILDSNTMLKISKIIADKDMPDMIATGVPGIGKTTTIRCIARGLFGKHANEAVLELNASDDRGIKAVQDTIKTFCKKKLDLNQGGEKKYAEHKIIILDEADNMTSKAQHLINTLMEKYHKTTRFAFTCNSSSDIIEAIQSRCLIFRYFRLNEKQVIDRLKVICERENISYDHDALVAIATISDGDMRKAINSLQLTYNAYNEIFTDYVYKVCDKPQPTIMKKIFSHCLKRDHVAAMQMMINLKESGYSGSDIVLGMLSTLKLSSFEDIDERIKIELIARICKTAYIISKGVDTILQLSSLIANLCEVK
jgi:replication factor C subunit 2/4